MIVSLNFWRLFEFEFTTFNFQTYRSFDWLVWYCWLGTCWKGLEHNFNLQSDFYSTGDVDDIEPFSKFQIRIFKVSMIRSSNFRAHAIGIRLFSLKSPKVMMKGVIQMFFELIRPLIGQASIPKLAGSALAALFIAP